MAREIKGSTRPRGLFCVTLAVISALAIGMPVSAADAAIADGVYTGTGETSVPRCHGGPTTIEIRGRTATWQAGHRAIGSVSADGSVHIKTMGISDFGIDYPAEVTGRADGNYFNGVETEIGSPRQCVWQLHLKNSRTRPRGLRPCKPGETPADLTFKDGSSIAWCKDW